MEKSFRKSVSVFGIFVSGVIVGCAATVLSGKSNFLLLQFRERIGQASIPKILPAIPEFDKEYITLDVETHLGLYE